MKQLKKAVRLLIGQLKSNYKFLLLIVLFIMLFSAPLYVTKEYKYEEYTFDNYAENGHFIDISSDTIIEQSIDIDGDIKELGFYGYSNSEEVPFGIVEVSLYSGDEEINVQYINMEYVNDGQLIRIPVSDEFDGEDAKIVFKAIEIEGVETISLYCSPKATFGTTSINNVLDNNNSVYMNIEAEKISSMHLSRMVALFILLLLFIYSGYLILKKNIRHSELKLYAVSILMILTSLAILKPMAIITPETFAEGSIRYFLLYRNVPIQRAVFYPDAGYWPLVQRIISILATIILSNSLSMPVMTIFGTIFMAAAASRFILPCFKEYYSVEIRFLISVFIGLLFCAIPVPNELCTFINFIYAGIIIVFTNYMLDFDKLKTYQLVYLCATSIVVLSKGIYLAFMPVVGIILLVCIIKKRNLKLALYSGSLLGAGLLQVAYMVFAVGVDAEYTYGNLNAIQKAIYAMYGAFGDFIKSLSLSRINHAHLINYICLIILIAVLFYCIRNLVRRQNQKNSLIIIGGVLTAYISYILVYLGKRLKYVVDEPLKNIVNWSTTAFTYRDQNEVFSVNRQTIMSLFLIFFCAVILIDIITSYKKKNYAIITLVFVLVIRLLCDVQTPVVRSQSVSNWSSYIEYIENDTYSIMTNPPSSSLRKNAGMVYIGEPDRRTQTDNPIIINPSFDLYTDNMSFTSVDFTDYSIENLSVVSVYIKKCSLLQKGDVHIILYDESCNEITRKQMEPAKDRLYLGFLFNEPVQGVYSMAFEDENGAKFEMQPEVYIGVEE